MQVFPTLYKRDSKGKIREWRMEVEAGTYRTVAGLQDGQQVTSAWTVAEPKNVGRKNATTAEEQAISEVESHYTKKLDIDYYDNVDDIDVPKIFKPMLAPTKKWAETKGKINYDDRIFVQPKLDGIRCIITQHGAFSRKGKKIVAVPHIVETLAPVFEIFPDAVIDGELYNHELKHDFNTITSIVRREKVTEEDLELSARMVQYHVYDYPGLMHEPFAVRYDKLIELCFKSEFQPQVQVVNTIAVSSEAEVDEAYGKFIEEGYEGGIVRRNGPYEQKRSKNLIKRKDFEDAEFEILRIEEGSGNWAGFAKRVVFKNDLDGREVGSGLKGNRAYAKQILDEADQYIGKQVTIQFIGRTPAGVPRFPIAKALYKEERM